MSDPRIPVWTWREAILKADVPPLTKLICHTLAAYLNDVGQCCWPTVETLMQQTGMGNKAIATHLKKAEAAGLLTIERQRTKDGRIQKNVYRPRFPNNVRTPDVPATQGENHVSQGHEAKPCVRETRGPDVFEGVSHVSQGHGNSPLENITTDDRATNPHELWDKLSDAANGALYPLALNLQVVSEPIGWITAGADLELDILPTVRAMAGRCKHHSVRSWSYFAGAVADARDRRLKGLPAPSPEAPMRPPPPSRADARIAKAREFKALVQRMVDEAKANRKPQ